MAHGSDPSRPSRPSYPPREILRTRVPQDTNDDPIDEDLATQLSPPRFVEEASPTPAELRELEALLESEADTEPMAPRRPRQVPTALLVLLALAVLLAFGCAVWVLFR